MLNQVPLPSSARNPRALITVNGTVIKQIDSIEYIENNYYQPDSFHIQLPLYNRTDSINIEYWLSQPAIMVEIFIGFPNNPQTYATGDLQSLILGGINDLNIKIFDNGAGFVEFDGFDLSKKFIDNKTVEKFPNQTSSQIVATLAQQQGLSTNIVPTTTKAGYYYTQDYVQMGTAITEWDLMTYLAQREGYQLFVRGTTVFFIPQVQTSPNPYVLQATTLENGQVASFDGVNLELQRNFNFAKDVIVNVTSQNAYSGRVTATAKATANTRKELAASAVTIGEAQTYDYIIPGLSKQQAIERAQQLAQDITLHERVLMCDLPGDNKLRKDSIIQLNGVSESANQTYFPDTISRRISTTEGYSMNVRAKNHSPQSIIVA